MNLVYDALNNLESPDFYLGLRVDGASETPPPGAKLRGVLARWLATLERHIPQRSAVMLHTRNFHQLTHLSNPYKA